MNDKVDVGNTVMEEFLRVMAKNIMIKLPIPPNEPKEIYNEIITTQKIVSFFVAEVILSINSRWN